MNQLDALKQFTTVVADTGDFKQLAQFQPQDATTNPSLILKAVQKPEYAPLLQSTVAQWKDRPMDEVIDRLLVRFGCEILATIPGRVSTEVDARLSFDTGATVTRAERIIELYQAQGIHIDRVLIKVAATWEGIKAAEKLEQRGLRVRLASLGEWLEYVDDLKGQKPQGRGWGGWISHQAQRQVQQRLYAACAGPLGWERRITAAESVAAAGAYVRPDLEGEAVLTLGSPLAEWRVGQIAGVVSVGPLECMPNKIAEAQFFHAAERERLPSLTLSLHGEPLDTAALDNFAFEVRTRLRQSECAGCLNEH